MTIYDAVVIGVGGVGSFALRALSKHSGGKFLGLERFRLSHTNGSSHGKSRIYRRAYFENPHYVPWIEHSLNVFRELEATHKVSLLQECGTLLVAPSISVDVHQQKLDMPPLLAASNQSAMEHGIPVEFFNSRDLRDAYPQLKLDHSSAADKPTVGLLEPQAGMMRPELTMKTAIEDAKASPDSSVDILENAVVQSMESNSDTNTVTLRVKQQQQQQPMMDNNHDNNNDEVVEHEIETRSVLVSMGSWTGHLLPTWDPHLKVTRQLQSWIDVKHTSETPEMYSCAKFPAWFMQTPDWHLPLYGLPSDDMQKKGGDSDDSSHWIKVSSHCRDHHVTDLANNPKMVTAPELSELRSIASHGLSPSTWSKTKSLQPEFIDSIPCLYTMSPDGHFIIGTPQILTDNKNVKNVFAVAGLSGHGFKMTPALGQMMADFATGQNLEPWRLQFCSPSRFQI